MRNVVFSNQCDSGASTIEEHWETFVCTQWNLTPWLAHIILKPFFFLRPNLVETDLKSPRKQTVTFVFVASFGCVGAVCTKNKTRGRPMRMGEGRDQIFFSNSFFMSRKQFLHLWNSCLFLLGSHLHFLGGKTVSYFLLNLTPLLQHFSFFVQFCDFLYALSSALQSLLT